MLWALASLGLSAALAPAATAAPAPTPPTAYALNVLSTLECPNSFACPNVFDLSNAAGINDRGWIVGDANVPGSTSATNATEHATLWRNGQITDLGTLGGPNSSIGFVARPNETGLISGNAETATSDPKEENWGVNFGCDAVGGLCAGWQYPGSSPQPPDGHVVGYETRGFIWTNGVTRPLPTLGGDNALALGSANDRGQIIGLAENATVDSTCQGAAAYTFGVNQNAPIVQVLDFEAVVWGPQYGEIHELPPYPGDSVGGATAINDNGQVVGASGTCGPPGIFSEYEHALLWQNGRAINLGSLGGQYDNYAAAINNLGQVVGGSDLPGDTTTHAFLWQNGVMTDLGTLPGDNYSAANAINAKGQVVGQSCDTTSGNCRGFLWQHGVMTDLNAITDKPASFDLLTAEGINDQGVIVGNVFDPAVGTFFAYAATPAGKASNANQRSSGGGHLTTGATAAKVILPATVRAQLRARLGVGLLLGRAR